MIHDRPSPKEIGWVDRSIRWFQLTGNRFAVSVVLLVGFVGPFFVAAVLDTVNLTPDQLMGYLNGAVNGLLTLVPISVGANQIFRNSGRSTSSTSAGRGRPNSGRRSKN